MDYKIDSNVGNSVDRKLHPGLLSDENPLNYEKSLRSKFTTPSNSYSNCTVLRQTWVQISLALGPESQAIVTADSEVGTENIHG